MAHRTYKDWAIKLDNAAGSLTAITGSVNAVSLQAALNLLEDSGMGDDDRTYVPGLHGKTEPLNGWVDSTVVSRIGPLVTDRTSITKTIEVYNGIKYYNGEVWPANVQMSGNVDDMQTWSVDATFEGGMNRTSVAL